MDLDPVRMEYKPTVFFNEFWLLKDHLIPLNETVSEVQLHLSVGAIGSWKWMIFTQMEQSFSMQVRVLGTRVGLPCLLRRRACE